MAVIKLSHGAHLNYEQFGSGQPIILVHGSPGDGRVWARVIKHLPSNMRALIPDLPGYGGSDPPPCEAVQRTQAMAAAVNELIDDCADPVWLCGHSYGGNVALHAALDRTNRVRGLILLEPVFTRALELAGEREALAQTHAYFRTYLMRVELREPDAIASMVDFWFGSGAYAKLPPHVRQFLNAAAERNAKDVEAASSEAILASELTSFARPVLIVYGGVSHPVAQKIAKSLCELLPQARVEPLPSANHAMLDGNPRDIAELISRFCAR